MTAPREFEEEYFEITEEQAEPRVMVDANIFDRPIRELHYHAPRCLELGAPLAEAVTIMREHSVGAVMITQGGRLRGILSERDILRKVLGTDVDLNRATVDQSMTPDPEVLTLDDAIAYAIQTMHVGGFRHVPLVDAAHRPVGIVSVKDVNEYIVSFFAKKVLTLPPDPHRQYEPRIDGG
ncbi:MAG: cyclic nucleotide-binding/CBS domain-containing protein [Candidatus Methylomirabilales bacterium]